MLSKIPLSIYIHFPWCLTKCHYCDFNSFPLLNENLIEFYVNKLLLDIYQESIKWKDRRAIKSIYFGGGTPNLLSKKYLKKIITTIKTHFEIAVEIEITLEINPESIDYWNIYSFKEAGINRFSVGIQSFDFNILKNINRHYSPEKAISVINMIKNIGVLNFNVDFMFGIPKQSIESALKDLEIIVQFKPPHISRYQYTVNYIDINCDDEEIFRMQYLGQKFLCAQGYQHYEVSSYSIHIDYCSRHNMNYWLYGDYIGIGAGAHSKMSVGKYKILRYEKISNPNKYIYSDKLIFKQEIISGKKLPIDFLMNVLRLYQPLSYKFLQKCTGYTIKNFKKKLYYANKLGLIVLFKDKLIVTEHGQNFLNDLLEIFCE